MTHVGYIAAGWAITLGVLALYAILLVQRGRSLSREVAADRRRWMTTEAPSPTEQPGSP